MVNHLHLLFLFLFFVLLLSSLSFTNGFFTDGVKDQQTEEIRQIKVNGDSVGLDELGPMIITKHGTARRINNWADLTPKEQAATWKRIVKRNRKRTEKLKLEDSRVANEDENSSVQTVPLLGDGRSSY
jgi:predicted Fe-S protein YdhL (DUF1289 family)